MTRRVQVQTTLGSYAYGMDNEGNKAATFTRQNGVSYCNDCRQGFTSGWVFGNDRYAVELCGNCVTAE